MKKIGHAPLWLTGSATVLAGLMGLYFIGAHLGVTHALAQDAAPAASQPAQGAETAKDPKTVVATIDGAPVTRQDVLDSAETLPDAVKAQIDTIFPQLIDRYIGLELVAKKARDEKLADDPEVKKLVARAEADALRQVYLDRYLQKKVSEDQIKARYDKNLKSRPAEDEVKAAHILVEKEEDAKAIIAELKKGGDFAAIAKEKSLDKQSGAEGGELGYFTRGMVVKEFGDAAFSMKKGQLSEKPVKTQFGWHIIKVEDSRKQPAPSLEQQHEGIRRQLAEEAIHDLVASLRKAAKVEITDQNAKPTP